LGEYEQDPILKQVTARAVNPGNLEDSRALRVNTPAMLTFLSMFIIRPFIFLLRRIMHPTMRAVAEAAVDIVGFAANTASPGERGYFYSFQERRELTRYLERREAADIVAEVFGMGQYYEREHCSSRGNCQMNGTLPFFT
jgi:hypothetical protein